MFSNKQAFSGAPQIGGVYGCVQLSKGVDSGCVQLSKPVYLKTYKNRISLFSNKQAFLGAPQIGGVYGCVQLSMRFRNRNRDRSRFCGSGIGIGPRKRDRKRNRDPIPRPLRRQTARESRGNRSENAKFQQILKNPAAFMHHFRCTYPSGPPPEPQIFAMSVRGG